MRMIKCSLGSRNFESSDLGSRNNFSSDQSQSQIEPDIESNNRLGFRPGTQNTKSEVEIGNDSLGWRGWNGMGSWFLIGKQFNLTQTASCTKKIISLIGTTTILPVNEGHLQQEADWLFTAQTKWKGYSQLGLGHKNWGQEGESWEKDRRLLELPD